jgi:hypothetical protein
LTSKTKLEIFIPHEREGEYFTIPFEMPADTASLMLSYHYDRYTRDDSTLENGSFTPRVKVNIIDLGLVAADGSQVGASGSDKSSFTLSATAATPGYTPHPLTPGQWQILVGAYKVAASGVTVTYELEFTPKQLHLYKGDIHTHTLASDGVLTAEELGRHALRHGLDFLAITDHNQMVSTAALPRIPGITLIPGVEWTHYQGHATFLGVDQPYDAPFFTNTVEDARARFISAHERGALISIAHPFEESCPFKFEMGSLPFDCLEVWNGPMRESNLRAVGFWLQLLATGKKIPITGGSDYHRDALFQILGGPCMGVYALSDSPADLLSAIKQGHSYISFAPNGPVLSTTCGSAMMGDTCTLAEGLTLNIHADGLKTGDVVRILSADGNRDLLQAPVDGICELEVPMDKPGFIAVQILRTFLPGIPPLPALLSNPIYFER